MATINWATGISAAWTIASDWTGGVVPGPGDNAVIAAAPVKGGYTVTLDGAVQVAGLTLDQAAATLSVTGSLSAQSIGLQAGTVLLNGGTLAGTVTQGAGTLAVAPLINSTLNDVTWQGTLAPVFQTIRRHSGTLTIHQGLALTGADGTGPGAALFDGPVGLDQVSRLDNAAIVMSSAGTLALSNTPSLTLGAGLSLTGGELLLANHSTVSNEGTLNGTDLPNAIGVFVNDGQINATYTILSAARITNNGNILVGAGDSLIVPPGKFAAPGARGSITLNGGYLVASGTLTTASLLAFFAGQHVVGTGAYGFGISGTLDNSGATLAVGPGTTLGLLDPGHLPYPGTLSGGTIQDTSGALFDAPGAYLSFQNVAVTSTASTMSLNGVLLNGVTLAGPHDLSIDSSEIFGGTLSALTAIDVGQSGGVTLSGVAITPVRQGAPVTFNLLGNYLELSAGQAIDGTRIHLRSGALILDAGLSVNNALITGQGAGGLVSLAGGDLLGAGMRILLGATDSIKIQNADPGNEVKNAGTITGGGLVDIGNPHNGGNRTYFQNSGSIVLSATGTFRLDPYGTGYLANAGTLLVHGGTLELSPHNVTNTGSIAVTNGTLILDGATLAELSEFAHPGSVEWVDGLVDFGGKSVTPGRGGVPLFALNPNGAYPASLENGTLAVAPRTSFGLPEQTNLEVQIVNNGTLLTATYVKFAAAVTGHGTIELTGANNQVELFEAVGSGQVLDMQGANDAIVFNNAASESGFAAAIAGFSVGDSLYFSGETLTAASFSGDSIRITLSTGATMVLATTTALSGTLTVGNNGGVGQVTYSGTPSAHDWPGLAELAWPETAMKHAGIAHATPWAYPLEVIASHISHGV